MEELTGKVVRFETNEKGKIEARGFVFRWNDGYVALDHVVTSPSASPGYDYVGSLPSRSLPILSP